MNRPMGIACGASHTLINTDDGEAYSWGDGFYGALGFNKLDNQH
jgi:alpha-tubulin suppressor-like RCC1 family protein